MSLLYSVLKPIVRWPVFTFLPEGREGEREIIADIRAFFGAEGQWGDEEKIMTAERSVKAGRLPST